MNPQINPSSLNDDDLYLYDSVNRVIVQHIGRSERRFEAEQRAVTPGLIRLSGMALRWELSKTTGAAA